VAPSTDGTASLVNREIGRALLANYRKLPFSGAVERLNEAATAPYFGQLSGESPETRTAWRITQSDANCSPSTVNRLTPERRLTRWRLTVHEQTKTLFYFRR